MMPSSRIALRPATLADADIILDWENNLENWAVSNNDSPYSLINIQMLILSLRNIRKACQARYMIIEINSDRILGSVDLYEIDWDKLTAGVGVLISDPSDRSKGFASEALLMLEQLVIEEWDLKHFNAEVHLTNIPSIKLFENCNYVKKDVVYKALSPNGGYIETILFEKWLKN
ncbi:MAG: GNAT family protein [Crocinitomicaceae bacterium]|nr:GNAT family protein [Crocinitomicaceae bacterium]MDG1657914.1 GNAT family protein [Crocinitomicaceae bacterium]